MSSHLIRAGAAVVLAAAAGGMGYVAGSDAPFDSAQGKAPIAEQTVAAPAEGTTRIIYSLDKKQNDQEIIALIDGAKTHIYFAMYEFTLRDIADVLVAAKQRGIDVQGLVDSDESAKQLRCTDYRGAACRRHTRRDRASRGRHGHHAH